MQKLNELANQYSTDNPSPDYLRNISLNNTSVTIEEVKTLIKKCRDLVSISLKDCSNFFPEKYRKQLTRKEFLQLFDLMFYEEVEEEEARRKAEGDGFGER